MPESIFEAMNREQFNSGIKASCIVCHLTRVWYENVLHLDKKVDDSLAYSMGDYVIWNKHYISNKIRKTVFCRGICSS